MLCRFPGPHPGGKLRGLARGVSRPTPGGSPGPHPGGLQAHTERGESQHALKQTHPLTATAVGGTHPTGMHSCLNLVYLIFSSKIHQLTTGT